MTLRFPPQLGAGFLLLAAALLTFAPARAQTAQESFGRVRIQYKKFDWQQFSTQNFTVYYYQDGEASARRAAEYAEVELQRITALIGYYPYSKTSLLLYNSVGDLRQSNIGLDPDQQLVGAQSSTLTRMSKVQIAFTGQQTDFKRELSFQITQVLLNDMMYGGSLKEVLQSSYLLQLPDWFIGGASAYAAEGWSVEMDGYLRDMVRQYPTGNRTAPFFLRNPRLAGQSIWNYVAERYGYTTIQNILNLTRITRDVEVGISSSLNVPYKIFLRDWLTYYRDLSQRPATAALGAPDDKYRLSGANRHNAVMSQPVLSPNGQQLAYAENEQGRYRVVVVNRDGSRRHTVSRGGYKTPDQQVEARLPALAWRGNTQVAIAEESRGQMALHLREARGMALGSRLRQALRFRRPASVFEPYSQVLGLSYSPDGKALVFSGVRNGQNDIYLLRAGGRVEQLTNDLFDDAQPVFLPGGQGIVFSSNRYLDSAGVARPATFPNVVNNYDLFLYHLDGRPQPVETLVSTISNETRPRALNDDEIVYLGEESGVRSLYRYNLKTRLRTPLTSFAGNLEDADYNPATSALAFVARSQARDQVFVLPNFQPAAGLILGKTARQQTLEDRSVAVAAPAPAPAAVVGADTVASSPAAAPGAGPAGRKAAGTVNTSNYEFEEDEPVGAAGNRRSARAAAAVPRNPALTGAPQLAGPYRYDTRFMIDNVAASLAVDPLLGIGLVGQANLSDVLENQRIKASIFGLLDFRTSNIQLSYTNITRRVDWGISYQKQAYFFDQIDAYQLRYGRHEIAPFLAYPLFHNLTVRGGPRYVNISRTLTNSFSNELDQTRNYVGATGELVFDNTIATGVNMLAGTRFKIGVLQLSSLDNKKLNYGKIYIDLRHYQKLVRQLVWANRVSYGQFLGPASQSFRLGGVDSWLNYKYKQDQLLPASNGSAVPDPTEVFAQQFVTNLHGFDYSERTGPRYVLFNSELRFPIVQFLTRKPIYSGFFRNLQLTSFVDAGTAYSGLNPFSQNNSYNTLLPVNPGNPFYGTTVTNFRNPLLVGYGFGARTTVLGFYLKGDVAWGEENYVRSGPKFYFSLGYDF